MTDGGQGSNLWGRSRGAPHITQIERRELVRLPQAGQSRSWVAIFPSVRPSRRSTSRILFSIFPLSFGINPSPRDFFVHGLRVGEPLDKLP